MTNGILLGASMTDYADNGSLITVEMDIFLTNVEDPSQELVYKSYGRGRSSTPMGLSGAKSNAMKNGFLKTFALATGDDIEKQEEQFLKSHKEEPKAETTDAWDKPKETAQPTPRRTRTPRP